LLARDVNMVCGQALIVWIAWFDADVPDYGLLNDLVWSDPSDTALEWEDNERGVSYCYGKAVINSFLATHVSRDRLDERISRGMLNFGE
jgi:diadenosine tetraphosphatase ApaH/serine/threonine PP2A family protein phosphatase